MNNIPMISNDSQELPDVRTRAGMNVFLSNLAGQDGYKVAAGFQHARETGLPHQFWRMADNRNIHKVFDPDALHPSLVQLIAGMPDRVSYFKDDLPVWNKVMEALDKLPKQQKGGYVGSWGDQMTWLESGRLTDNDFLELTPERQAQNISKYQSPSVDEALERKYYKLNEEQELREEDRQKLDKLNRVNRLMREFLNYYTDKEFKEEDDENIQKLITRFGEIDGIRTDDLSVADFREKGITTGGLKPSELVNFFGYMDANKALDKLLDPNLRPQNLAKVNESSPVYQQIAKLQMLEEENEMLRGLSKPAEVTNSVMMSLRLMAEIAATGGVSKGVQAAANTSYRAIYHAAGVPGVLNKFGSNLVRGLWGIAKQNVKRAPLFAVQSAAEAYNRDYLGGLVSVMDENGNTVQATEPELKDFWFGFVTHMFEHVNEMATEEMGELLPLNQLSNFVPKRVRNAIIARLGTDPMTRNTTYNWIKKLVPIGGAPGEWIEEEIGNFNSRAATIMLEVLNEYAGNDTPVTPGTENWTIALGGGRERSVTAWSLLAQQAIFGGSVFVANYARGYRPHPLRPLEARARFMREKEAINEATNHLPHTPLINTPAEMKDVLDSAVGDALWVLPFEEADALYQRTNSDDVTPEDKEDMKGALNAMGVTEKAVESAKKNGRDLLLSRNTVMSVMSHGKFKAARDLGNKIMENAVNAEYGVFGAKNIEVTKDTFNKKMLDEMDRIAAEQAEFGAENLKTIRNAIDKARADEVERAKAEGRAPNVMRESFTKSLDGYYALMNCIMRYLWVGSKTEAKAAVKDMIEKLSFRFAENPEQFNLQKAYADTEAAVKRAKENSDRLGAAEARYREALAKFGEEEKKQQERQKANTNAVIVEQSYTDAYNELQDATKELQEARMAATTNDTVVSDRVTAAQNKVAELEKQIAEHNAKVADIEERIKYADEHPDRSEEGYAKYEDLLDALYEAKGESDENDVELDRLNSELEEARAELEQAKNAETDDGGDEELNQALYQSAVAANNKSIISTEEQKMLDRALKSGDYIVAYRAAQIIDGNIYPPMAAQISKDKLTKSVPLKQWEKSYEQPMAEEIMRKIEKDGPESVKPSEYPLFPKKNNKGKWIKNKDGSFALFFRLYKGNGDYVDARYDPYYHSSPIPLNDQFDSAWNRDNIVILEVLIPRSEIYPEDGKHYKAPYAYKSTGANTWKAGPVASKLVSGEEKKNKKKGEKTKDELEPFASEEEANNAGGRVVYLSRYDYPVRVVPNEEVAQKIKETLDGKVDYIPHNVVTPSLRAELEKVGVQVDEMLRVKKGNGTEWVRKDNGRKYTGKLSDREVEDAPLFQGVIGIPGFYSNMMQAIEDAPQQKMTPAQWLAYLQKSGGMKIAEVSWRGSIDDFFKGRDPKTAIDKQELIDQFQDGMVDVLEIEGTVFDGKAQRRRNRDLDARLESGYFSAREDSDLYRTQNEIFLMNDEQALETYGVTLGTLKRLNRIIVAYGSVGTMEREVDVDAKIAGMKAGYDYLTKDKLRDIQEALDDSPDAEEEYSYISDIIKEHMRDAEQKYREAYQQKQIEEKKPLVEMPGNEVRGSYTTDGLENKREIVIYAPEIEAWDPNDSIHFGIATKGTAIAWVRFGETTDADGKRVLVIDEIQSNRHQEGRESGYKKEENIESEWGRKALKKARHIASLSFSPNTYAYDELVLENLNEQVSYLELNRNSIGFAEEQIKGTKEAIEEFKGTIDNRRRVPAAPFEKNWQELGMKRMIRYAAENGFDKVAWTSGAQQAKRYNIGNVVDSIERVTPESFADRNRFVELVSARVANNEEDFDIYVVKPDGTEISFTVDYNGQIVSADDEVPPGDYIFDIFEGNGGERIIDYLNNNKYNPSHDDVLVPPNDVVLVGTPKVEAPDTSRMVNVKTSSGDIRFNVTEEGKIEQAESVSVETDELNGKSVADVFGKELGSMIMDMVDGKRESIYLDKNTVIGGEGMKTFYDKILRNFTDKYIKKWGSKVGVVELPNVEEAGREMWGFDVTDKMREDVMTKGQPLFQDRGPVRAATYGVSNVERFAQCHEALIVLFKNADASTLPHESAHWLLTAMRALVDGGLGTEKMEQDLKTIDAWLKKQDYTAEAARRQGLMRIREDGTEYFDKKEMQQEYFARAFESYLRDGVLPENATSKLQIALRRLADFFLAIYDDAKKLDVQMDPSITQFFDSIIASDFVSENHSVLSDILQAINEGALGMSNEELANLEKALCGVREDAEAERWLAALKAYLQGKKDLTPRWKKDATTAYNASKVEKAFVYVRGKGHKLYEGFLRENGFTEETIQKLREKGLTVKNPYKPVTPEEETVDAKAIVPAQEPTEATAQTQEGQVAPTPAEEPAQTETPAETASIEAVPAETDEEFSKRWRAIKKNAEMPAVTDSNTVWRIIAEVLTGFKKNKFADDTYDTSDYRKTVHDKIMKAGGIPAMSKSRQVAFVLTASDYARTSDLRKNPSTTSLNQTTKDGEEENERQIPDVDTDLIELFDDADNLELVKGFMASLKDGNLKQFTRAYLALMRARRLVNLANIQKVMNAPTEKGGLGMDIGLDNLQTHVYPDFKAKYNEWKKENPYYQQDSDALNQQSPDPNEAPQYIMKTLQDLDYETVEDLVADLLMAKGKDAFISDFMAQKLEEYKRAFMESPEWNSDAGALKYLDAILNALQLTKDMKFSQRVAAETDRAEREMKAEKTVGDMLQLKTVRAVETSLKASVARLLKTIKTNKGNREAAVHAAVEVHRLAAQLKVARQLHAEVEKMLRQAKRFGKTKAGVTVDGDALNAIKALNRHFGLSNAKPTWTTRPGDPRTPYEVVQEMVRLRAEPMRFESDAEKEAYISEVTNGVMTQWSDKMQRAMLLQSNEESPDVEPFTEMKYGEFEELGKVLQFFYKSSRDMMESIDGSFASELKKRKEAIFGEMAENKTGDYSELDEVSGWEKTKSRVRSGLHIGKSMQWFAHLFTGYKEFYGKHDLGAFRRYFELPIAEGESKQYYWQQNISGEVKPHLEALMRSCKNRGISAKINSENAIRHGGYGATIKGKTMAFVLLNAGNLGNRQRLMASYGWSEDELNNILTQFSEEDFKHADAIWASLAKLGREMADVFYKERHYRMKHVDSATIELTNYEGKRIVSLGGYYPLAYKYSGVRSSDDFDIANPPHRPEKMAEPSSTKDRAAKVEDRIVRLDWAVLNKHIHEGSRYIGLWEPLRMANAIYRDKQFYRSVTENFGREAYDVFSKLMDFVNNPDQRYKYGKIANRVASIMATTALGFKVTTMEKQWASLWVGVDRLGNAGYFTDAFEAFWSNPKKFVDAVSEISPFIRDRYNLIDRDLTVLDTEFKKPIEQFEDRYRRLAFLGMKKMDLCVAAIQWKAAFDFAQNTYKDMTISMCRAWADDFVASSQGAARTIDIPAVQLDALGRMLTPFFGPACAAANTRIAGLSVIGKMDAGERLSFAVENFVVPALMCAFIMAVANGLFRIEDDDDWDRVRRSFLRNLLSEPISGIPFVQDVADAMVGILISGRASRGNVFEVGMLRPAEDMMSDAGKILVNLKNLDNLDQSLYIGARIAGEWYGIPVIQAGEDYEKMAIRNHFYPFDNTIEKTLGDN